MDMDMKFFRKLPVPKDLKEQFPADERIVKIKQERDPEIRRIFEGKSDKLLLIIGPCSADREDAVLDYVTRLSKVQEKVKDKIMIIPRIYTNKPRTTGGGYKGLVHQPELLLFVSYIRKQFLKVDLLVRMKCCIPKTIVMFLICYLTLQSEHVL